MNPDRRERRLHVGQDALSADSFQSGNRKRPYHLLPDRLPFPRNFGTSSLSLPVSRINIARQEYLFQNGVDQWWVSINVANHRYPLQTVEIMHSGNWQVLPRASYNYW